jgi:hypothetical protein
MLIPTRRCVCALALTGAILANAPTTVAEPGPATEAAAGVVELPELRAELLAMREKDQAVRQELMQVVREADGDTSAIPITLVLRMKQLDATHLARLKEIVDAHGWPANSMVGEDGANAAWLLIQHADRSEIDFMERSLRMIEAAWEAGEADGQHYAYLVDRLRMYRGEPQIYGTQSDVEDGEVVVWEIEDEETVDERRATVGLPPLAEQIAKTKEALGAMSPQED